MVKTFYRERRTGSTDCPKEQIFPVHLYIHGLRWWHPIVKDRRAQCAVQRNRSFHLICPWITMMASCHERWPVCELTCCLELYHRIAWRCFVSSPADRQSRNSVGKKKSVRGQLALINKVLRVLALDNLSYNIIFRFWSFYITITSIAINSTFSL